MLCRGVSVSSLVNCAQRFVMISGNCSLFLFGNGVCMWGSSPVHDGKTRDAIGAETWHCVFGCVCLPVQTLFLLFWVSLFSYVILSGVLCLWCPGSSVVIGTLWNRWSLRLSTLQFYRWFYHLLPLPRRCAERSLCQIFYGKLCALLGVVLNAISTSYCLGLLKATVVLAVVKSWNAVEYFGPYFEQLFTVFYCIQNETLYCQ